jgi:hypothetical protein
MLTLAVVSVTKFPSFFFGNRNCRVVSVDVLTSLTTVFQLSQPVVLVVETRAPRENHRPATSQANLSTSSCMEYT